MTYLNVHFSSVWLCKSRFFHLSLVLSAAAPLVAECSDAGFCRLPVKPAETAENRSEQDGQPVPQLAEKESVWSTGVTLGYANGDPDEALRYTAVEAQVGWTPRQSTFLSAAVPWNYASGDDGSTTGIGDLLLTGSQGLSAAWSIALGLRLPTGDDAALEGAGLAYQPGLGSTDVLAALIWQRHGFDVRAGYVASLGTNGTPGVELERGDDVAAGIGYSPVYGQWEGRIGLLGLLRLEDSKTTASGTAITIPESAGAQANLQLEAGYRLKPTLLISVEAAVALIAREKNANVDGLTRSSSISLGATQWW